MHLDAHTHEINFNGLAIAPGDTFEPFPQEAPGYLVTFDGIIDGRVYVSDRTRTLSIPLADIPAMQST